MERQDLIFRVFVSSTFSDLIEERSALQETVFPELRKHCQQRGARFQAIDLRWGVGQEAALDQQTMNICLRELRRCQELSPRPNFIVLLGNRYGWRPLPAQVEAQEFESLLARLTGEQKRHVLQWYKRDDNALPPEYCLLTRTGEFVDADRWAREEADVRAILLEAVGLVLPKEDLRRRKWYDSATHQEIRHGAMEADESQEHVFCYFRQIDGLPADDSAAKYRDIHDHKVDAEAQGRLEELKGELKGKLPREHVHEYAVGWQGGRPELDKVELKRLCENVERDLKRIIDQEVEAFQKRPALDREAHAQREFAEDRCRHFVGREDVLEQIGQYIESQDQARPLIIHGRSGCGKRALMAKAALGLADSAARGSRGPVVYHFIGATPASCDLRSLLTSLCRQLGVESVPTDMNELVNTFRDRLSPPGQEGSKGEGQAPRPVTIFLDALDQLNPSDNARMLYWLPRELAGGVKLVLSVLQTDKPAEQQASPPPAPAGPARPDPGEYDCFDLAGRIWPGRLVEVGGLDDALAPGLLTTWLEEAHRTLQPAQQKHILARFHGCPLPLYLKLAVGEARRWKSWDDLPHRDDDAGLSDTVEGILLHLLLRLEEPQNHGPIFVRRALGYIAAAKNGLTEDELLEVLSADKDVMEWFHTQSPTEQAKLPADRIQSLPVVVWSRLFVDIEPYMTRRRADGTVVMDFYHRQVRQAVARRYLAGEARWEFHQHLAEYFHTLDYWAETLEAQRARAKRLPPTPRPANVRKVVELPYHRLEVAKLVGKDDPKSPHWDAVADLLMDWQFLEAKAEADPNFREQESAEPLGEPR